MGDVHSESVRSYNMSRIKGKDTKPEETVRKYLFSQGFRYHKNRKDLPGKPDIVLPRYKTVIFVNGCFWHHHDCEFFRWPKSNEEFWRQKINGNVERDHVNMEKLRLAGWNIIVVWECSLKKEKQTALKNVADMIRKNKR